MHLNISDAMFYVHVAFEMNSLVTNSPVTAPRLISTISVSIIRRAREDAAVEFFNDIRISDSCKSNRVLSEGSIQSIR